MNNRGDGQDEVGQDEHLLGVASVWELLTRREQLAVLVVVLIGLVGCYFAGEAAYRGAAEDGTAVAAGWRAAFGVGSATAATLAAFVFALLAAVAASADSSSQLRTLHSVAATTDEMRNMTGLELRDREVRRDLGPNRTAALGPYIGGALLVRAEPEGRRNSKWTVWDDQDRVLQVYLGGRGGGSHVWIDGVKQ